MGPGWRQKTRLLKYILLNTSLPSEATNSVITARQAQPTPRRERQGSIKILKCVDESSLRHVQNSQDTFTPLTFLSAICPSDRATSQRLVNLIFYRERERSLPTSCRNRERLGNYLENWTSTKSTPSQTRRRIVAVHYETSWTDRSHGINSYFRIVRSSRLISARRERFVEGYRQLCSPNITNIITPKTSRQTYSQDVVGRLQEKCQSRDDAGDDEDW